MLSLPILYCKRTSVIVKKCCKMKRFLLLYGSQSGQAQSIAESICQQAHGYGYFADLHCLSETDKYNLKNENDPLVIVVSTTGVGDPPDNAIKFVKEIKLQNLPADCFAHLRYAVLALGDSGYSMFCNCGKTIDKRLQELGAQHFYDTGLADEVTGSEAVVDPWICGLWEALKKENASEVCISLTNGNENCDIKVVANDENVLKLSDINTELQLLTLAETEQPLQNKEVDKQPSEPSLTASVSPLSQSALSVPSLPPAYLEVNFVENTFQESELHPVTSDNAVFQVPVTKAREITRADAVKTALLLELDISETSISYQPGDTFSVVCPNSACEVEELLERLRLTDKRDLCVSLQLKKDTKKRGAQVPLHVPKDNTLHFLLTWCLEIRAIPKKAFLRALVEHTTIASEKRRLQELCSKEGASDFNAYIRDCNTCVLDLLRAFPSCQPPLSILLEHLPKLQARSYSAASSTLYHPGKLHFVFNIVEFPWFSRKGVCTGWLQELVTPLLQNEKTEARIETNLTLFPKMSIFVRESHAFRLPEDHSVPIVMVGPGTGVAPFIGFLQHREELRKQMKDSKFGETWLFFGCRHHDRDYFFREDLERFVENGTLNQLKVCFSRDLPVDGQIQPKYVQDNIVLCSEDIIRILTVERGHIYICGDGKNMAKDVRSAFIEIFVKHCKGDQLDAMNFLAKLKSEGRYLEDVWS
ncbi:methionine synthase reductase [Protopterus annectens]|uniref:methionine synthase reductase n=1 Tax=Protopterus annectens TaxID=7888 RepID=UPI001CFAB9DE|nr:methionine synthase reductase [Protopterus annectens]